VQSHYPIYGLDAVEAIANTVRLGIGSGNDLRRSRADDPLVRSAWSGTRTVRNTASTTFEPSKPFPAASRNNGSRIRGESFPAQQQYHLRRFHGLSKVPRAIRPLISSRFIMTSSAARWAQPPSMPSPTGPPPNMVRTAILSPAPWSCRKPSLRRRRNPASGR
jgi:hypothetical protein